MTMKEASEEFRTSPLATKVIAGLLSVLIGGGAFWCIRVTTQLDALLKSASANEKLAESVKEQGAHISQLYVNYNNLNLDVSKQTVAVTGLVKDMDIVKNKLFK